MLYLSRNLGMIQNSLDWTNDVEVAAIALICIELT